LSVFLFVSPDASDPVIERANSLLSPSSVAESDSITAREDETDAAFETFKDNPVIGIGAGGDFGTSRYAEIIPGNGPTHYGTVPQYFVHNQYLEIALYYGIGALVVFVAIIAAALWRSFRQASRSEEDRLSGLQAALCGSIVAVSLSAIVGLYFLPVEGALATGLILGLPFADRERR
jgi:O-antigen ligase